MNKYDDVNTNPNNIVGGEDYYYVRLYSPVGSYQGEGFTRDPESWGKERIRELKTQIRDASLFNAIYGSGAWNSDRWEVRIYN